MLIHFYSMSFFDLLSPSYSQLDLENAQSHCPPHQIAVLTDKCQTDDRGISHRFPLINLTFDTPHHSSFQFQQMLTHTLKKKETT